jgi:hypothetical protein
MVVRCVLGLLVTLTGVALIGCTKVDRSEKAAERQEQMVEKMELQALLQMEAPVQERIQAAQKLGQIGDIGDAIEMVNGYRSISDEAVRAAVKDAVKEIESREGATLPEAYRKILDG